MIWERVVPGKHGTTAFMIEVNEAEINTEAIPGHIYQGHTLKKYKRIRMKHPHLCCIQEISTKPQHYLYPLRKIGCRLNQRIMISDIFRGF